MEIRFLYKLNFPKKHRRFMQLGNDMIDIIPFRLIFTIKTSKTSKTKSILNQPLKQVTLQTYLIRCAWCAVIFFKAHGGSDDAGKYFSVKEFNGLDNFLRTKLGSCAANIYRETRARNAFSIFLHCPNCTFQIVSITRAPQRELYKTLKCISSNNTHL